MTPPTDPDGPTADRPWRAMHLVVVDVETTGLDATRDRVIEIGIVHFEHGEVVDRYAQLVDPGIPIPEEVTRLTGIRPEDVAGQPTFAEVADQVRQRLARGILVAYNLPFDTGFLRHEFARAGVAWPESLRGIDPLVFVRQLHPKGVSKRLTDTAKRLGIPLSEAHRAVHDAEATGWVLLALASQLPAGLDELLALQAQWRDLQEQERRRWRKRTGEDADLLQSTSTPTSADGDELPSIGPAYVWGQQTDPMRALFAALPDVGGRRH